LRPIERTVDRNLWIGIAVSLVFHAIGAGWAVSLSPRPRSLDRKPPQLVRTVRERIELPRPKPKPPEPKPEVKKDDPPAKAAPTEAQKQVAPARKPVQPKSAAPVAKAAAPHNDSAPLVISKTYGAAGDGGVAVETGQDDVLGDPGVAPTEDNVRRRPPTEGGGDDGQAKAPDPPPQKEPRRIEIVQARPRESCNRYVSWPDGAESGGRVVEVTLQLEIGEDGAVRKVKILRGAGDPFDSQAVKDIQRCPFSAGTRDGKPMVSKIAFVVEFKPRS